MMMARATGGLLVLCAMVSACSVGSESQTEDQVAPATKPSVVAASDVTTLDGTTIASFTGNAENGKVVFAQCRACHVTDAGVNMSGPSLHGIIGRMSGTVPGYNYSAANAGAKFVWTKEKLFQHLEKPQRVIPGTKMMFSGIQDAQKRADVIAYLETPG